MSLPFESTKDAYLSALNKFDIAVCEANAISQGCAERIVVPTIGLATRVFTRMCGSGVSMIRAAPHSRWVRADFDDWQFSAVAGHARCLLDGFLLFEYLIEPSSDEDVLAARIDIIHLNDCTRRIKLHKDLGALDEVSKFEVQRNELIDRLGCNRYFQSLKPEIRKKCLDGENIIAYHRNQFLKKIHFPEGEFNAIYGLWSQYIHVLPMSFHRMEPNGRGTGIENNVDRTYITQALSIGAEILSIATDSMVKEFSGVSHLRKGINSKFSPGPKYNAHRCPSKESQTKNTTTNLSKSILSEQINKGFG